MLLEACVFKALPYRGWNYCTVSNIRTLVLFAFACSTRVDKFACLDCLQPPVACKLFACPFAVRPPAPLSLSSRKAALSWCALQQYVERAAVWAVLYPQLGHEGFVVSA